MHKVLFIDPNGQARGMERDMLDWRRLGFELEAASCDAEEAMRRFEADRFSVVLIHIQSAESYGLRLCERIREGSDVPIVLVGGSNDFELARRALCIQVNDYLPHPVAADELEASLKKIMRKLGVNVAQRPRPLPIRSAADDAPPVNIIEKVKAYVDEALHQNITLKEISTTLHFNCSYLGQKFKLQENMTFNEYLLRRRMERAKYLLEHTDMKVYEIASEVGYTEMDWFYKKFKAYTGVSANEYRKRMSITA